MGIFYFFRRKVEIVGTDKQGIIIWAYLGGGTLGYNEGKRFT